MENRELDSEIDLLEALGLDLAHYTRAELESLLRAREAEDEGEREAA